MYRRFEGVVSPVGSFFVVLVRHGIPLTLFMLNPIRHRDRERRPIPSPGRDGKGGHRNEFESDLRIKGQGLRPRRKKQERRDPGDPVSIATRLERQSYFTD
jgi:hypothetical protein